MSISIAREYLDLVKFHHTLFALPFALLGAVLAAWSPDGWRGRVQDWLGILLCMATARSAAMAFNRLVDRDYDALNPRTAGRHLPTGRLSASSVAAFTVFCALAFVASSLMFLPNRLPLILAVPVLLWLLGYSYTKRFTSLAHFWLGASLMLAPLAAWIAILGFYGWQVPLVLGLAVLFWVAGFDILYACQDVAFDRQARLRSIPARMGVPTALRVAFLCHVVMVAFLFGLFVVAQPLLGWIYLAGVSAIAILLAYEHYLVSPDDLTRVNQAFFHVNAIVSVGLFLIVLVQVLVPR